MGVEYLRELTAVGGVIFCVMVFVTWLQSPDQESAAKSEPQRPPVYSLGFTGPQSLWADRLFEGCREYDLVSGEGPGAWPLPSQVHGQIARGGKDVVTTAVSDCHGNVMIVRNDEICLRHEVPADITTIADVDVSADGNVVHAVYPNGLLLTWTWQDGAFRPSRHELPCIPTALSSTADGQRVLIACNGTQVMLWDVAQETAVFRKQAHLTRCNQLAWAPGSEKFLTGGDDGFIRLWDASTGGLLWETDSDSLASTTMTFNPEGTKIATGGFDQKVRVWDSQTGTMLHELVGHCGPVRALAFSPNGEALVSGGLDGRLLVWSTTQWSLSRELN